MLKLLYLLAFFHCAPVTSRYISNIYTLLSNIYTRLSNIYVFPNVHRHVPNIYTYALQYICNVVQYIYVVQQVYHHVCWITCIYVGSHTPQYIYMLSNIYITLWKTVQHICPTYIPNIYMGVYMLDNVLIYIGYICWTDFIYIGVLCQYICWIYMLDCIYICWGPFARNVVWWWVTESRLHIGYFWSKYYTCWWNTIHV